MYLIFEKSLTDIAIYPLCPEDLSTSQTVAMPPVIPEVLPGQGPDALEQATVQLTGGTTPGQQPRTLRSSGTQRPDAVTAD